ncbi:transcriptional regulator [Actinocrispum sp. NPDC049592]|uniref:transcriptional regulator n=1 Tax=Actinocrispum sp. NPDC049592 TaxID=3154835 RepID=UPI003444F899
MANEGLQFDPAVVPRLRTVFTDALAKVDEQIKLADAELHGQPWAGDPVSEYAGQQLSGSADEALTALRSYREALDTVVGKLTKAGTDYRESDQDNNVSMSRKGEG